MRKFISISLLLCGMLTSSTVSAYKLSLYVQTIDTNPIVLKPNKAPVAPFLIDVEGQVISFLSPLTTDYTLFLLNSDGETAYSVVIPAGTTSIILPTELSGDYELQLYSGGNYYFYCDITL